MKTWCLRVLAAAFLMLAIGAVMFTWGHQPPPLPQGSVSAQRWVDGTHEVVRFEQILTDASRPTQANGGLAALPSRTLPTLIWHPADAVGAPFPLLIFSHGFLSRREGGAQMAEHLAAHGFVVMAATYPLTNLRSPGGPNVKDVVHQPGDISFLINTAAAWNADPSHALHKRIRTDDVGAFGVSLGGLTSTLAAYHPTARDPRVRHVASLAGPLAPLTQAFFTRSDVDYLMVAGRLDAVVPYAQHASHTLERIPGAALLVFDAGSHIGFSGLGVPMRWLAHPDLIPCTLLTRDPNAAPWYSVMGTRAQGVLPDVDGGLCSLSLEDPPMNAMAQLRLTQLAVTAFFESTMGATPAIRAAAAAYLSSTMATEVPGIRYTTAVETAP